jgi:hypothetical protein
MMTRSFSFLVHEVAPRPDRPRGRRGARTTLVGLLASLLGVLSALVFLSAAPAGAAALIPKITNQSNIVDVAFDPAGNLYESEIGGNVNVWPVANGTIFGHSVVAGRANTLATLHNTPGITVDANGDLFIADQNGSSGGSISVLPAASGTLYGQPVTTNTLTTLVSGIDNPIGVAVDAAGNLYYATQNAINVLPASTTTLYGQAVTADTPAVLVSGLVEGGFMTFDASGDLYYTDIGGLGNSGAASVNVLPVSSGTIFGQSVTADTPTALVSGLSNAAGLAMDGAGNLYVDDYGTVEALANSSGTLDGTAVSADVLTPIAIGLLGDLGATFHAGNVYVADQLMDSVDQLATPTATISSVTFGGSAANPIVTVTGTGFATSPPTFAPDCSASGQDYKYGNLYLSDTTGSWGAGIPGDCVGLTAAKITATKAVFGLGSFYPGNFSLNAGDAYTVGVDGTTSSGTVSYVGPSSAIITKVKPAQGPGGGGTAVTIKGTNLTGTKYVFFGSTPAKAVTVVSSTEITTTAPAGSGTVAVEPVSASGEVGASSATYTYAAPTLTGDSPAKGSAHGGTTVTLTGTNLTGTSSVEFGSSAATSFTVVSNTEVKAVSPAEGAGTVPVTVSTPAGTSNGVNYKFK